MDIRDAYWIWDGGEAAPVNAYRIFRKTFVAPEGGTEWIVRISADTRYQLVVNGRDVARGPAPSTPGFYTYDEVDVTEDIVLGQENTITIIVTYYGEPTFSYYRNRGGLLFQLGDLVSDETWQVAKFSPWQSDTPRLTVQQGFCEYYDADSEPTGMYYGETDPDEWVNATIVSPAEGGAWKTLEARDIPMPERKYRANTTLIEWGNCTERPGDTVAGRMTNETLRPLLHGQIERDEFDNIMITPEGEDVYLLFDFGEEVSGFLDFDVRAEDGASGKVDIGYDEALRVGETPSGMKHDWGSNSDLRYADQFILTDGEQTFQNFGDRAFRYVRLAFRGLKAPVTLTSIGIYESTYPVNRHGVFTCSDARLDKIWEIGRRTLQLCMDDRFMDCPWRERAQWVGDAKVEALGAAYCFGDTKLHRRFLRQIAQSQLPDGHTLPNGPGEWEEHQANPIPGFTAIWIHSLWDYYLLTGDKDFCVGLRPHVTAALEWLGTYGTGTDGLLSDVQGWNFTDWAPGLSGGNVGVTAPVNLFYSQALRVGAELARLAGDATQAETLDAQVECLRSAFDDLFWDKAHGVWVDAVLDGTQQPQASQQTNSLALLYGIGSEERRASALSCLLDDTALTQIGSPYFSYYLLAALFRYGQHEAALAYIRKHWGQMLDAGATTWWEEYHGETSRCHAWSIGPTIDLMAQYLGVTPSAPGYASVQVAPHPGDLRWAKGSVPTPQGGVAVNWQRTDTGFLLHISTQHAMTLDIIVPAGSQDSLLLNGQPLEDDQIRERMETGILLNTLPGGGYAIEVVSAG